MTDRLPSNTQSHLPNYGQGQPEDKNKDVDKKKDGNRKGNHPKGVWACPNVAVGEEDPGQGSKLWKKGQAFYGLAF